VVARTSDVGAIAFDGQPLTTQSRWKAVPGWGYSYVAFPVTHGPHVISVAEGSSALFAAYSYGHSPRASRHLGCGRIFSALRRLLLRSLGDRHKQQWLRLHSRLPRYKPYSCYVKHRKRQHLAIERKLQLVLKCEIYIQ